VKHNKFFSESSKYSLFLIILFAVTVRILFFIGHIYSDDAYYNYLSFTLIKDSFLIDYFGYPIFVLRLGHLAVTALSFYFFGVNETASILFPFITSIGSIVVTFLIVKELEYSDKTALVAAFLTAVFSTDVVFASIAFPEAAAIFFVNIGLLFLIKATKNNKTSFSIITGVCLVVSFLFKEYVIYYIVLILIYGIAYYLSKNKLKFKLALIPVAVFFIYILLEGFCYYLINNSFFFRFEINELNYQYCKYDFFPNTVSGEMGNTTGVVTALFNQIVMVNLKAVFFRRFYLFLPALAFVLSILSIKKKENLLLSFWFISILFLLVAFTHSIPEYRPVSLNRNWYIYPLILPSTAIAAVYFSKVKKLLLFTILVVFTLFSFYMCMEYEEYFSKEENKNLKSFLIENKDRSIYSDHHSLYGLEFIRNGFKSLNIEKRLNSPGFSFDKIEKGSLIAVGKGNINELLMQGYLFPDLSIFSGNDYELVFTQKRFKFYKRL